MPASGSSGLRRLPKENAARRRLWDRLAIEDPDYAVLTHGPRAGRGWTDHLDEFYESGEAEVAAELDHLDPPPDWLGLAVDWGSGTGRLTLALARRFASALGVDISEHMVELAQSRAGERGLSNVSFVTVANSQPTQAALVFSKLVLQHMASRAEIRRTLAWMATIVAPSGYLIVQVPTEAVWWRSKLRPASRLWRLQQFVPPLDRLLLKAGLNGVTMTPVPESRVLPVLEGSGLTMVEIRREDVGGYRFATYVARRPSDVTPVR